MKLHHLLVILFLLAAGYVAGARWPSLAKRVGAA